MCIKIRYFCLSKEAHSSNNISLGLSIKNTKGHCLRIQDNHYLLKEIVTIHQFTSVTSIIRWPITNSQRFVSMLKAMYE